MEFYQLKTFLTVAREGHLTRAAERLHTSQPAVSAHIKALEDEWGITLFERTAKGMKLTHAGTLMKARAETVVQAMDAMRFEAAQLTKALGGVLRIGLNVNPHYLKVTELLAVMRNTHPGIELHYQQRMTWEAPADLLAGDLDAAFVYRVPQSSHICAEILSGFDLVIVAPVAWRNRLEGIDKARIMTQPWIWANSQCPYFDVIQDYFEDQGCPPNVAVVADQDSTVQKLVTSGVGLGMMIAEEANELAAEGKLIVISESIGTLKLALIYPRKRLEDPLIQALLKGIRKIWNASEPYETIKKETLAGLV